MECPVGGDDDVHVAGAGGSVLVDSGVHMTNSLRWVPHETWIRNVRYPDLRYWAWNTNNLFVDPAVAIEPVAAKGGLGH
jgi:hypothetical protein